MRLSDIVSHAGLAIWAEVGMVLFILAFIAVVAGLVHPGNRAAFDAARRLPFDDDPTGQPEEETRS